MGAEADAGVAESLTTASLRKAWPDLNCCNVAITPTTG